MYSSSDRWWEGENVVEQLKTKSINEQFAVHEIDHHYKITQAVVRPVPRAVTCSKFHVRTAWWTIITIMDAQNLLLHDVSIQMCPYDVAVKGIPYF